jgi:transposase
MAACDEQIAVLLERLAKAQPAPPPLPPGVEAPKRKLIRHNAPAIPKLHEYLLAITGGHDVSRLPGFTDLGFMKLIAETGTDLSRWKTEKHFTSWATLAPGSSQSGRRRKRVPRKKSKVGQIFREAVMSIAKSTKLALGAAYRRLKGRTSPAVAVVAIARKLAVLYYRVMTKGLAYVEQGIARYEEKYREQTLRYLQKKAAELGHALTPNPTPTPAAT